MLKAVNAALLFLAYLLRASRLNFLLVLQESLLVEDIKGNLYRSDWQAVFLVLGALLSCHLFPSSAF